MKRGEKEGSEGRVYARRKKENNKIAYLNAVGSVTWISESIDPVRFIPSA
jgi:hypothetical protein